MLVPGYYSYFFFLFSRITFFSLSLSRFWTRIVPSPCSCLCPRLLSVSTVPYCFAPGHRQDESGLRNGTGSMSTSARIVLPRSACARSVAICSLTDLINHASVGSCGVARLSCAGAHSTTKLMNSPGQGARRNVQALVHQVTGDLPAYVPSCRRAVVPLCRSCRRAVMLRPTLSAVAVPCLISLVLCCLPPQARVLTRLFSY